MASEVEEVLSEIPSYSRELRINLEKPSGRFEWLLASVLFAKRIPSGIAKRTFLKFREAGLLTPSAILRAGWDKLVEVLDSGGYVRYDFSTASTLLKLAEEVQKAGGIERIQAEATDSRDLERRLQELSGVGPVAVNIFLRELRGVWKKARPAPSRLAVEVAKRLRLSKVERFESALVRLNLEYCKRGKCGGCPVKSSCRGTLG